MMKNALEQASYIWTAPFEKGMDFYRIFRKVFSWRPEGEERVMLEIAADSTFAAFVNGRRCPISQVADFPEDRTFSTFVEMLRQSGICVRALLQGDEPAWFHFRL